MRPVPVVRAVALLAVAVLALACGASGKALVVPDQDPRAADLEPEPLPEPEPEPEPEPGPFAPLTGEEVDEAVLERPALLVKVDNDSRARPQTGLDVADVVYEERVEAGITRFLAVFHSELPAVAGPIRSARPVDAQLMSGYGRSGFAYSGARPDVQSLLRSTPSVVITEGGPGFFRDSSRRAPHNLYLDAAQSVQGVRERGAEPLSEGTWSFEEQVPRGALTCPADVDGCTDPGLAITIQISSGYRTGWEYDQDAGVYRRLQNGSPHQVTGEGRIGAANVVVLDTRFYFGAPNCYGAACPETDVLTQDAPALVLRDGNRYEARYRKPTAEDPIELLLPNGRPFPLKPGRTWVHLPDGLPAVNQ